MHKTLRNLLLMSLAWAAVACSRDPFDVDIDDIELELEVRRVDQALFALRLDSLEQGLEKLRQEQNPFFDFYAENVLGLGSPQSPMFKDLVASFVTDLTMNQAYKAAQERFAEPEATVEQLETSLRYLLYHVPDFAVPECYFCISGFNESVFTGPDVLAIALDKYLGPESPFYRRLGWERYLVRQMYPEKIPVDAMKALAMARWEFAPQTDNLLEAMIYEGKLQYFLDATTPYLPDSTRWGYSEQQLAWATTFEGKIWDYFIQEDLLFSTRSIDKAHFIKDGPFTNAFSNNSAPRAGAWVGHKIVSAYMRQTGQSLAQLMENQDAQDILNRSKYVPQR